MNDDIYAKRSPSTRLVQENIELRTELAALKSQLALAEKALVFTKESCEESDWSCSRCEKENDMTTTDLYIVVCEELKQIRGEGK